ncbi:MAG: septum formation initiator family protein [Bacteroidales bacterium]|nr:septum formation initiator family protein [Bacteroidales bacterium]
MKRTKKMNFWVRRRSHIAPLLIGGLVIALLFFNEDTSWKNNMEYQGQIKALQEQIDACNDSADWFRYRREKLLNGNEELEQIAREEYHMQKPTEDVFLLEE